jgi:hypothetical protein
MEKMNSTDCPNCRKDIGVWAIYKAPLPNVMLRCPHCKSKLRFQPAGWWMVIISCIVAFPIFFVAAHLCMSYIGKDNIAWLFAYIIIALLVWFPVEWFIAKRLRKRHKLVIK